MLGVTLLVNPLIQDEETCSKYNFDPYNDYMIHGIEKNLCVFKYDNPIEIKDESDFLYKVMNNANLIQLYKIFSTNCICSIWIYTLIEEKLV